MQGLGCSMASGFPRSFPSPSAAGPPDWRPQLFNEVGSGIAVCRAVDDGADFIFLDLNAAAEKIEQISRTEVVGHRLTEVFPGVADFGLLQVLRRVWRSGAPERHPLSQYRDARIAGWRETRVFRAPAGEIVVVYDDCTREVAIEEAEAHQAMIAAELNHRVKNLLASVDAMMRHTLRTSSSLEGFAQIFSGRLDAIARGVDLLLRTDWRPVELSKVLRDALGAFGSACQVTAPRQPVRLPAKAALGLNLILHELATNAAKYGALSTAEGIVRVDCQLSDERPDVVVCRWVERNGPSVAPPSRKGFGSRLIVQAAKQDLLGEAAIAYPAAGVECVICFPVEIDSRPATRPS
jgi:two-component sensor histidine kinase